MCRVAVRTRCVGSGRHGPAGHLQAASSGGACCVRCGHVRSPAVGVAGVSGMPPTRLRSTPNVRPRAFHLGARYGSCWPSPGVGEHRVPPCDCVGKKSPAGHGRGHCRTGRSPPQAVAITGVGARSRIVVRSSSGLRSGIRYRRYTLVSRVSPVSRWSRMLGRSRRRPRTRVRNEPSGPTVAAW